VNHPVNAGPAADAHRVSVLMFTNRIFDFVGNLGKRSWKVRREKAWEGLGICGPPEKPLAAEPHEKPPYQ